MRPDHSELRMKWRLAAAGVQKTPEKYGDRPVTLRRQYGEGPPGRRLLQARHDLSPQAAFTRLSSGSTFGETAGRFVSASRRVLFQPGRRGRAMQSSTQ